MELDQETYKMIVDNNARMQATTEKIDTFISETKCCLKSHDDRIRDIEIRGSKQAEEALEKCGKLSKRLVDVEVFKNDHEGQVKGVNWTTAIISGVIGAAAGIIGILALIWDKVIS